MCRPALRGGLSGCIALLNLPSTHQLPAAGMAAPVSLSAASAAAMLSAFCGHVFVRSLSQQDRRLAFELLYKALEVGCPLSWHLP